MDPKSRLHRTSSDDPSAISRRGAMPRNSPVEFSTPEDLLRHDRSRTAVPDSVIRRLKSSIHPAATPERSRTPWWRKLFGAD